MLRTTLGWDTCVYSFWGKVGFEQDLDGQGVQGAEEKLEERTT